ncbi:MAG: phosphate propanoyltransferase [Clostridia bacterium]|nr:phosphate propanoyltransferase [Clostridia bacterium]
MVILKTKEFIKMKKVLVETSARHIHLSREAVDVLFGEGYQLTNKKDLSQPGQYACAEKLEVVGPKGKLKASILGPTRNASQVELSLTDARSIGVVAPIRESGDIVGSGACKLVNPENGNELELTEGVIAAKRHIHLTPETAAEMGVQDKQIVSVKIESERTAILGDVVVRVNANFAPAMHIDTDEANATCAFGTVYGEIID